jgi:uncharacterized protein (UPF0335 family)
MSETPAAGHNSKAQQLAYVDRLCNLIGEQKALGEDIRELKAEAKANGFDPKDIAKLAALKRNGKEKARDALEVFEGYLALLDWLD